MTAWRSFVTGFWVTVGVCVASALMSVVIFIASALGLISVGAWAAHEVGGAIVEHEAEKAAAADEYREHVHVREIDAARPDPHYGLAYVYVTAVVENAGERRVLSAEFAIYFQNDAGKTIYESSTTMRGLGNPGYINKLSERVHGVPDEWNEGSVQIKLTGVVFDDE